VVILLGILCAYVAQVSLANPVVLKSVDPSPTNAIVVSTYSASVTFSPVRQFTNSPSSPCLGWFDVVVTGFSSQGVSACELDALRDAVTVSWSCVDCNQALSNGNVSISVPAPNAFTRSSQWSFSSIDYFGEQSSVSGLMAADADSYFKGAASIVQLSALSTNYTDRGAATKTGKLMKVLAAFPGSQVQDVSFGNGFGVGFQFNINAAPDWFIIQLTQKQTALTILAQILAIIGGVFSAGRVALALYFKAFKRDSNDVHRVHAQEAKAVELTDIGTTVVSDGQPSEAE
jgi:hypothetical protein